MWHSLHEGCQAHLATSCQRKVVHSPSLHLLYVSESTAPLFCSPGSAVPPGSSCRRGCSTTHTGCISASNGCSRTSVIGTSYRHFQLLKTCLWSMSPTLMTTCSAAMPPYIIIWQQSIQHTSRWVCQTPCSTTPCCNRCSGPPGDINHCPSWTRAAKA